MSRKAELDDFHTSLDNHGREFIARRHRFPANAAGFLVAPVLWMLYFVAAYSLQGVGCAAGLNNVGIGGGNALKIALALLTLFVAAAIGGSGLWSFLAWRRLLRRVEEDEHSVHRHAPFLAYGALLHAGLFLIATLWTGVPILMVDPCDSLGTT